MSIRATVRVTGVAKNTVTNLLVAAGEAFAEYQDGAFTDLNTTRVEADEIWSFCYAKQKNVPEDFKGTPGYGGRCVDVDRHRRRLQARPVVARR